MQNLRIIIFYTHLVLVLTMSILGRVGRWIVNNFFFTVGSFCAACPNCLKVNNAIRHINLYALNSAIGFPRNYSWKVTYPVDSGILSLNYWGQMFYIVVIRLVLFKKLHLLYHPVQWTDHLTQTHPSRQNLDITLLWSKEKSEIFFHKFLTSLS